MATFDLSVLTKLKDKFDAISSSIEEKEAQIQAQQTQLTEIEGTIQDLESQKMTLEMNKNALQEEKQKLVQLYEESKGQYETVNSSAQQLLALLNDEWI